FLESLDRFAVLPDETLVLPSHGLPFVGIQVRIEQLRAHHAARLAEIEAAAGEPVTAASVVPTLFRRQLDPPPRRFAMGEARSPPLSRASGAHDPHAHGRCMAFRKPMDAVAIRIITHRKTRWP